MDRHDLAFLRDSATLHFLDVSLPETVKQKVYQLLNQHIPMTVCRQEDVDVGQVKLAINCLVEGYKYRVACLVEKHEIEQITRPLSLQALLEADSQLLQPKVWSDFADNLEQLGCKVYVYGSYAYQSLTQEAYVRPTSDLDLLLYPQHQHDVPEILQIIQQVQAQSSIRLDGEIQIHPDWHVSFNELIAVFPEMKQQVIVKGIQRVEMLRLGQLFGGKLEYSDATTT